MIFLSKLFVYNNYNKYFEKRKGTEECNSPFSFFILKNLTAIYTNNLISIRVENCSLQDIGVELHIIESNNASSLCGSGAFDSSVVIVVVVDDTKIHFYFPSFIYNI